MNANGRYGTVRYIHDGMRLALRSAYVTAPSTFLSWSRIVSCKLTGYKRKTLIEGITAHCTRNTLVRNHGDWRVSGREGFADDVIAQQEGIRQTP